MKPKLSDYWSNIKRLLILLIGVMTCQWAGAQSIDIGIFESATPNQVEIKIRPDFQIEFDETISGILYTIRWEDPSIAITVNYLPPYFVAPQNSGFYNGYYYQVFGAVPFSPVGSTIYPGDEVLISSFSFTGGDCAMFEIIEDEWTELYNGNVYLEWGGTDVTGIIYESIADFGSIGGFVDGGGIIFLNDPTGPLTLTDYIGTINKWQKQLDNGGWTDIPGTSGIVIYSEIPTAIGVWEYRAEVQRGTCPVDYSLPAEVIVVGGTQWSGVIDDDWFKTGNWTNGVPNLALDAIIPNVDPNPYPMIDGDAICYGLDIAAGASVDVLITGTLTALGDFVNEGEFTVGSTPAGDGSFIDNGNISGSGSFTIERYLESEMWHYISPPISDGLSGIYLNIYLKEFHEEDSTWFYIVPVDIPLNPMQGYATWASDDLTGSTTVYYEGALNTGPLSIGLTNHGGAEHNSKGYNFVGNPYPSAVDWEEDAGWTKTNLDAAIYLWNPANGQYGSYTYGDPGSGTNQVDSIIPSGQGFFVHVTDGNSTGSLGVNNNARLHHSKPFFKEATAKTIQNKYLKLKTYSTINEYIDETIIQFKENATELYDPQLDAYKFQGLYEAPQLYTVSSDAVNLAFNNLPLLTGNAVVPLNFSVISENGIYTVEVLDMLNFDLTTEIFLEDLKENIVINLNNQQSYSFYADSNDDPERFNLHFIYNPATSVNDLTQHPVSIFSYANNICIRSLNDKFLDGNLMIFNILGERVYAGYFSSVKSHVVHIDNTGIYIVAYYDHSEKMLYRKKLYLR